MRGFLFLFILGSQAGAAPASRTTQSIFDSMQSLVPQMCAPASTLRVCFSVNKETCDSRVTSAFETCLRDQKIKYAGQTTLDPKNAADAENSLKSCVLKSYSMATWTSYRKSADCDKWVPQMKKQSDKAAKVTPLKKGDTAFEDPLDAQRDLVGRYKLRLLHDVRMVQNFQNEMKDRKTCLNDKTSRESNINCFKRAITKFEMTSSVQVPSLMTLAVSMALKDKSEGFASSNAILIDAVLAVSERVQIEKFHLVVLRATNETDRMTLTILRNDDEKILRKTAETMYASLKSKLNEPTKERAPANVSNLKMRIEALKATGWVYPKPTP